MSFRFKIVNMAEEENQNEVSGEMQEDVKAESTDVNPRSLVFLYEFLVVLDSIISLLFCEFILPSTFVICENSITFVIQ